ncbi:MAG: flagellar basal body-associated protein FliL [Pseudomonadota bacterium]|jgi:flagellar basal body-associated protein FliL
MASDSEKPKEIEHAATAKGPGRKKMLVVAGVVLSVLGIGAPVGYFILTPAEAPKEEIQDVPSVVDLEADAKPEAEPAEDETLALLDGEEALGAIVPFETFLVNLSGGKYLRLQLQAEMETPDIPRRLYGRIVPIRDGIIMMLTQKTSTELEDPQGKEALKKGIKDLMNEQLRRQDVRRIYFTQFVIQ